MIQYPHILKSSSVVTDSVYDEATGNWVPGVSTAGVDLPCRAESEDGSGFIVSAGGVRIDYSWIIYLPKEGPGLKEGTQVEVYNGAEKILTDKIKRFHRGQLNTRAWV